MFSGKMVDDPKKSCFVLVYEGETSRGALAGETPKVAHETA